MIIYFKRIPEREEQILTSAKQQLRKKIKVRKRRFDIRCLRTII